MCGTISGLARRDQRKRVLCVIIHILYESPEFLFTGPLTRPAD